MNFRGFNRDPFRNDRFDNPRHPATGLGGGANWELMRTPPSDLDARLRNTRAQTVSKILKHFAENSLHDRRSNDCPGDTPN